MDSLLKYLKNYLPRGPYTRVNLGFALVPILISIIMLTLDRYGLQDAFLRYFSGHASLQKLGRNSLAFYSQLYFSASCLLLFIGVPILFDRLFPSRLTNPYGLSLRYCSRHLPMYALLLLIMLPILWLASGSTAFYEFYPMYKPVSIRMWALYELIYMAQFVAVEFFFRGFALFRLERLFRGHAVTVMVIPYSLLHIHKPFPEMLASIVAGLVLGHLALKGRSIWPGIVVHGGVALSMDAFALIRAGRMEMLIAAM